MMINLKVYDNLFEVKLLLADCMWADNAKILQELEKYISDNSRMFYGKLINNKLVGILGLQCLAENKVEIKHIAVHASHRKQGIGRSMINEYIRINKITTMVAETDKDAVCFYRRIGFKILSLGEKYPNVERFQCVLSI